MTVPDLLPAAPAALLLAFAALASGVARGFSGFGAALIFVPLAAAAVGPRVAAPLLLVMDFAAIVALLPGGWRMADRKEVGWLTLGVAAGLPAGVALLAGGDPVALRWLVSAVILALLAMVASGWRFSAAPRLRVTLGVGAVAGVLAGVALVPGPPVMAWLLGRHLPPAQLRAIFSLFLAAAGVVTALAYAVAGLFTAALLGPLLVAWPVYGAGVWIGARLFGVVSEAVFRRACYAMIAAAALVSLPVWDGWLR
ncbi:sulfite exporter TauE/SafE family protein [Falsiroseomonas sp. CW058]|uniref:sulfite exporter TauE/SafE family protein n=1 Tax=Falsiroseomonas sp. CW058 TaxID=3388664 RepID=UPI003D315F04